jgi:hypothetical protein
MGAMKLEILITKNIQFWDSIKVRPTRVTSSKVCSHSSKNSHIDGNIMERVSYIILDELMFVLPYGKLFICGVQVITNLFQICNVLIIRIIATHDQVITCF